jgi:hypothetical protein
MVKHLLSWFKIGKTIHVNDKMQNNYSYQLSELPGKNFDKEFKPHLSPKQMLVMGVFEGKYLNDCENEFPREWYSAAKKAGKLSLTADISINQFKIKSRLSLQEWRKRHWIPITKGDEDVRGWFQWYCRYWIGRRDPNVDLIQIKRWKSFIRHQGQIIHSLKNMKPDKRPKTREELRNHRPRQRQALLQWAYNPYISI